MNFTDASHAFADIFQLNFFDDENSDVEDRWIVIDEIPTLKIVVMEHTFRQGHAGEDARIRIISARKATKNEREDYFARRP